MTATLVPFERYCADRLVAEREVVAAAWVERIASERRVRPRDALPSRDLLDGIPEVLVHVSEFLCADREEALRERETVTARLAELARLRHAQGADPQELVGELELLARVLDGACLEWVRGYGAPPPEAVVRVAGRLNRAALLMAEVTVGAFAEAAAGSRERDAARLRAFADGLAHELRSPLSAAETAALVLEDDEIAASVSERRRFATLVRRSLHRARAVLDDVRSLALAGDPDGRRASLAAVLEGVLAETAAAAAAAGVRVEVEGPVPPLTVSAAPVELILLNLVQNAIRYSDPDRTDRRVVLSFERDAASEGGWWISVRDNGLGIAPVDQPRVFDRFVRVHPGRAEGTGLGLAIVREAAREMGSRLQLESEPGVGSTFRFTLREG